VLLASNHKFERHQTMNEIKTHTIIYFLIIFGFFISVIYLCGYWSSFNINVFQYVSIQQVVTVSIYPLLGVFASFCIGYWYGALGEKKERTKLSKIIERFLVPIFFIYVICLDFLHFWLILSLLLSFKLANVIIKNIPEDKILINRKSTSFFITTLIVLPLIALSLGMTNAKRIKDGDGVRYVDIKYLNNIEFSNNQERVKYLGLNGDFYFFMSDDNNKKIFISKTSLIPILEISQKEYKDKKADIVRLFEKLMRKNNKK